MTTLRFKPLLLAAALGLLASAGIASADGENTSHTYCPRGSMMVHSEILGYFWCRDTMLIGIQPVDCKSGPGQAAGTWNNGTQTPDQLCQQTSSSPTEPAMGN